MIFKNSQFHTLTLICDTLAPRLEVEGDAHGFYARSAADLGIATRMNDIMAQYGDPALLADLRQALDLMGMPLFNAFFSGINKPFATMTLHERTQTLVSWAESNLPARRKAFQALKRLALFLYYAVVEETGQNPNWITLGYATPTPPAKPVEKPIQPLAVKQDTVLEADVVIVGSGAGGSVVAAELAQAGHSVIVIEKGGYYAESDFDGYEERSLNKMFEQGGYLVNHDLSVAILAASTLGGGTTINWSASFHTPDYVLAEWERDFALPGMADTMQKALNTVAQRLHVNVDESQPNPQNAKLEQGAKALNYQVETIPRNVQGCGDCGFCNYGCPVGAKQGTLKNYLLDAYKAGARILIKSHVQRVLIQQGKAVGVEVVNIDSDGQPQQVIIKAKKVVISGGAIHTPAILLRSGLTNSHIGRNLHLHPTSVIYGLYDEPICGWSGVIMSRVVKEFANLDGDGYGVMMETAPVHPGVAAMNLSWQNGYQHKAVMANLNNLANVMIITRDRFGGRVRLDQKGQPRIEYKLDAYDANHMIMGIVEALRIQHAAGAKEISAPYNMPYIYRQEEATTPLEHYLAAIEQRGLRSNNFALLSAHQMSTARMAGSARQGAITPDGETYEVKNLYVADASALPTASGVNPMLTIMAMAHRIASGLKASLG